MVMNEVLQRRISRMEINESRHPVGKKDSKNLWAHWATPKQSKPGR